MDEIITVTKSEYLATQRILKITEPEKLTLKFADNTLLRAKGEGVNAEDAINVNFPSRNYKCAVYFSSNENFFVNGTIDQTFSVRYDRKSLLITVIEVVETRPNFIIDLFSGYIVRNPVCATNVINLSRFNYEYERKGLNPYRHTTSIPLLLSPENLLTHFTVRVFGKADGKTGQRNLLNTYEFPLLYRQLWVQFLSTVISYNEKIRFKFRINYDNGAQEYFQENTYTLTPVIVDIYNVTNSSRYRFLSSSHFKDKIKIARFNGPVHVHNKGTTTSSFSGKADILPLVGSSKIETTSQLKLNLTPLTQMSNLDTDRFPLRTNVFVLNSSEGKKSGDDTDNLRVLSSFVDIGNSHFLYLTKQKNKKGLKPKSNIGTENSDGIDIYNFYCVFNAETNTALDIRITLPIHSQRPYRNDLYGSLLCVLDCGFSFNLDNPFWSRDNFPSSRKDVPPLLQNVFSHDGGESIALYGCDEVAEYFNLEDLFNFLSTNQKDKIDDLIDEDTKYRSSFLITKVFNFGMELLTLHFGDKEQLNKNINKTEREVEISKKLDKDREDNLYYDYIFWLRKTAVQNPICRCNPPSAPEAQEEEVDATNVVEELPFLRHLIYMRQLLSGAKKAGKPVLAEVIFGNGIRAGDDEPHVSLQGIRTHFVTAYEVQRITLFITKTDLLNYLAYDEKTFNMIKDLTNFKEIKQALKTFRK